MTNTTAAAKQPIFAARRRRRPGAGASSRASVAWLQAHWLQILIALGDRRRRSFVALHLAARASAASCASATRARTGWGTIVRPRDRAGPAISSSSCSRRKLVAGYRRRRPARSRRRSTSCSPSPRCSRRRSGRARSSSARSSTAPQPSDYPGEALVSAMGLIRLLVTFALFAIALVVVLDNLGVNVTGLVAGPRRRRHRDRSGRAGHLRRSVRGARDHLRPPVPARRRDHATTQSAGTVERIGLKSTRIRGIDRRRADHRQQEPARQGNPQQHAARLSPRRCSRIGVVLLDARRDAASACPTMLKEIVEANEQDLRPRRLRRLRRVEPTISRSSSTARRRLCEHSTTRAPRSASAILKRFNDERIDLAFPTQTT